MPSKSSSRKYDGMKNLPISNAQMDIFMAVWDEPGKDEVKTISEEDRETMIESLKTAEGVHFHLTLVSNGLNDDYKETHSGYPTQREVLLERFLRKVIRYTRAVNNFIEYTRRQLTRTP